MSSTVCFDSAHLEAELPDPENPPALAKMLNPDISVRNLIIFWKKQSLFFSGFGTSFDFNYCVGFAGWWASGQTQNEAEISGQEKSGLIFILFFLDNKPFQVDELLIDEDKEYYKYEEERDLNVCKVGMEINVFFL